MTVSILDKDWSEVKNMLNSGIIPSIDRIKEFLVSSCASEDCKARVDKAISCIADILRLEEDRGSCAESSLKQLLVLLESDKSASELRAALAGIAVSAKEPVLVVN